CHPRKRCVFLSKCSVDECDVERRNIGLPGSPQKALQDLLCIAPPASQRISVSEPRKKEGAEARAILLRYVNRFLEFRDCLLMHSFLFVVPAKNGHFPDIIGCPYKEV